MAIKIVETSISNPALAMLRARRYEKAYIAVPNTKLDADLFADLSIVYQALTGEQLPVESNTFLIKSKDGYLERLFAPVFGRTADNKLAIRWGASLIPVTLESKEYSIKPGQYNQSGRGMDTCIFVTVKTGKDVYRLPVALRQQNWDSKISVDELDYMLADDYEQLIAALGELKEGSETTGGTTGEILSLRDFEVDEKLTVIAYKEVKTNYGSNFIITLSDGRQSWGHKSINAVLAVKPTIDENNPAELVVIEKREYSPGKWAIKAVLFITVAEDDDSLVF